MYQVPSYGTQPSQNKKKIILVVIVLLSLLLVFFLLQEPSSDTKQETKKDEESIGKGNDPDVVNQEVSPEVNPETECKTSQYKLNNVCVNKTVCGDNEVEVSPGDTKSDRTCECKPDFFKEGDTCSKVTTCLLTEFETKKPTKLNDRECKTRKTCNKWEKVVKGNETNDDECTLEGACANIKTTHWLDKSTNKCNPLTACGSGQISEEPKKEMGVNISNRTCKCPDGFMGANCEIMINDQIELAVKNKGSRGWCEAPQGPRSDPPWTGDCYTVNFNTKQRCESAHTGINIQNLSGCKEENGAWAPYFKQKPHCEAAMQKINSLLPKEKYQKCQRYVGGEGWSPTRTTVLSSQFITDVLTKLNAL